VLVDNGQTGVLGGIYEQNINTSATPVPFFSDILLLGELFSTTGQAELLISLYPESSARIWRFAGSCLSDLDRLRGQSCYPRHRFF
jgi:hypothetical protein